MVDDAVTLYAWVMRWDGTFVIRSSWPDDTHLPLVDPRFLPLVDTRLERIDRPAVERALQLQANRLGREMRLVCCREEDTMRVLHPRGFHWKDDK